MRTKNFSNTLFILYIFFFFYMHDQLLVSRFYFLSSPNLILEFSYHRVLIKSVKIMWPQTIWNITYRVSLYIQSMDHVLKCILYCWYKLYHWNDLLFVLYWYHNPTLNIPRLASTKTFSFFNFKCFLRYINIFDYGNKNSRNYAQHLLPSRNYAQHLLVLQRQSF